jgi:hypothetical protein
LRLARILVAARLLGLAQSELERRGARRASLWFVAPCVVLL